MPVLSQPMNNGAPYPGPMGYGAPMPQPSVHHPPSYAYQQAYYSPQGGPGVHMTGQIPMSTPVPMNFHDQVTFTATLVIYKPDSSVF